MLGGYRRTAADRGRGQAAPLRADGLAAILATAARPRTDGRGVESHTTAHRRGRLDAVIAGLLFMGGLRRSEVSALEWRDVSDASDGDGVLLTVRTSKTNQEGDAADVRYLKNGAANAIRTLRAAAADARAAETPLVRGDFPTGEAKHYGSVLCGGSGLCGFHAVSPGMKMQSAQSATNWDIS